MRFILIFATYFLLFPNANAQLIPDSTSIDSVYFGVKSFEFSSSSHEFSVFTFYYYKPQSYNPVTSPILFAIHGDQGNGMNEIVDLMDIAERRSALIVAPNFATSGCMQEQLAIYSCFDSAQVCTIYGPATEVMKSIYKHVLQRENRVNVPAYMIGFSAGGQFVTRYMLIRQAYPDSIPLKMAVSTNPAYYTFPTDTFNGAFMPWACGLAYDSVYNGMLPTLCSNALKFFNFRCNSHIVQYYNENYGVLIGSGDTQPYGAGCMLDQGANRYERAVNFYNFCDSNAVTRGTTLQWAYAEVPGVGHSQSQMYLSKVSPTDSSTIAETFLFDTPYHSTSYSNPVASFYADTTVVSANSNINFTNTSQNATSYLWDFGDNNFSTQANPSHAYNVAGTYNIQLTAYGTGCDNWTIKRDYIRVTGSIQATAEKFRKKFSGSGFPSARVYSAQQTNDNGFVSFGTAQITSINFYLVKFQSNGDTAWTRQFGGNQDDYCKAGQQTFDGGYIMAGYTQSFVTNDQNFYLVKTDSNGNLLWSKTYSNLSISFDWCYAVQQTIDSGYVMTGYQGGACLLKTNSTGDTLWTKKFNVGYAYSVVQTNDGGFALTGYGNGSGIYIIKTDPMGNLIWAKTYAVSISDYGYSIKQTSDGGYIVAGISYTDTISYYDVYLIKTDSAGNLQWSKVFDFGSQEYCYSVEQTNDGNYVVAVSGYQNNGEAILLKTDNQGNILWTKNYVASLSGEFASSVSKCMDGGFVIGGGTGNFGSIIKTDSLGNSGCNDYTANVNLVNHSTQVSVITPTITTGCTVSNPATIVRSGSNVFTTCNQFATGVNEPIANETSFTVYPNPSSGNFTVVFSNQINKGQLELFNVYGEVIFKQKLFNESQRQIKLNVSSGVYFLIVANGEKRHTQKLIINKP